MNRNLEKLHPYPFEKLNALLEGVSNKANMPLIAWSVGEPKHPAPDFLVEALSNESVIRQGFGAYPPTRGLPELRDAISDFLARRYSLHERPDPETQVLPVTGTREALFSFANAVLTPTDDSVTVMPNPFYQIYEGAALLAGSEPHYVNCSGIDLTPDFDSVPNDIWQRCQLLYLCSPGNPTGGVLSADKLGELIKLSDEHGFIIAADECYSEIYLDESDPPPGLLEVASALGRHDYRNCIAFNSLSKRSNLPGLRSGYVTGDARILEKFLLYRTYQGAAMPVHHQLLSAMAWQDEHHVRENREIYRSKFKTVVGILNTVWPMETPRAGFYLWPETPMDDQMFTRRLIEETSIKVIPGSFLSRDTKTGNPGTNRVRMALVATEAECIEAAERIVDHWEALTAVS
ncbi:MAG: succinyldiaminopimelate transaminase [Gammaproteobacteria bacterium]|jgi:N-succinyldiaminopimelate aminotransferase|nr:succinyldiaminopimelate transaminase [Gammaproteobacteria bacterium]MBT4494004.1 succinyldiaminopimelate transaminase [Gammaproteobacteria bacterium]MBT7369892.1 succinyldiaminopimelate transaminase [Gammaproteobacteria bacterium]